MSVLDWERKFKKLNKGKSKFPLYQALFIQILSKYGPINSKMTIKNLMLDAGMPENQFDMIYNTLKKMHVLKYNIGTPKGWYIEPTAADRVDLEYPNPIILKDQNNYQKGHFSKIKLNHSKSILDELSDSSNSNSNNNIINPIEQNNQSIPLNIKSIIDNSSDNLDSNNLDNQQNDDTSNSLLLQSEKEPELIQYMKDKKEIETKLLSDKEFEKLIIEWLEKNS
ncbi:MAG: hypothetical protein ACTSRZ_15795 [Promethearchaeota archaeon]